MGGYYGYSMSNRAVEAYNDGEKPLSKWTKKDIISEIALIDSDKAKLFSKLKLSQLKNTVLFRSSWHHTSKEFNCTDFYSVNEELIENISDEEILMLVSDEIEEQISVKKYRGTIHYLDWSGSRKHPKATEMCLEDVNIEERGCFYYITDDSGMELLKKKIGSNGTRVINFAEEEQRKLKREEKERTVRKLSSTKAIEFYDKIKDDCDYSSSNHIYKKGRKPSPYDYDNGLKNFFAIGECRLRKEITTGILHLEMWNGECWVDND